MLQSISNLDVLFFKLSYEGDQYIVLVEQKNDWDEGGLYVLAAQSVPEMLHQQLEKELKKRGVL